MGARRRAPADQTRLLSRLHDAIDHGDRARARRLLKRLGQPRSLDGRFARWRLLSMDEDLNPALQIATKAAEEHPDSPDVQHARGWTLLALARYEDAIGPLEEACYLDPDFADAWYDLATAREACGDLAGMKAAFTEVYSIDHAPPLPALRFSPDQVMQWAERAVLALPTGVQEAARGVPIFVQDHPDPWILDDAPYDPRLLGLFDGPTYAETLHGGSSPHIYLFHRNLEAVCPDARVMAEQVRITIHHEVGHYLGLDEHDLHDRGLG
jgi:predicted Zn-dependent protease with MMP-like domain